MGGAGENATARPHAVPSTRRLCAASLWAPRPTSRTLGLGVWDSFPSIGDSPEPLGLYLLGLQCHEPRVHSHGEMGSVEPPYVEQTPCFSTEAKEEEPTSPSSYRLPCACDLGSLMSWLVVVIIANASRALTPCQALCHMLCICLAMSLPVFCPFYR